MPDVQHELSSLLWDQVCLSLVFWVLIRLTFADQRERWQGGSGIGTDSRGISAVERATTGRHPAPLQPGMSGGGGSPKCKVQLGQSSQGFLFPPQPLVSVSLAALDAVRCSISALDEHILRTLTLYLPHTTPLLFRTGQSFANSVFGSLAACSNRYWLTLAVLLPCLAHLWLSDLLAHGDHCLETYFFCQDPPY